ncbi:MAG: hypothetical protein AAGK01_05745, partial [Pseudomonadota bacterium]
SNPYCSTGAGASLMLLALQILRSFAESDGCKDVDPDTHPSASERIAKISARHVMQPKRLEMDQEFNNTVARIMSAVSAVMDEALRAGGDRLVKEVRQQLREAEADLRNPD